MAASTLPFCNMSYLTFRSSTCTMKICCFFRSIESIAASAILFEMPSLSAAIILSDSWLMRLRRAFFAVKRRNVILVSAPSTMPSFRALRHSEIALYFLSLTSTFKVSKRRSSFATTIGRHSIVGSTAIFKAAESALRSASFCSRVMRSRLSASSQNDLINVVATSIAAIKI